MVIKMILKYTINLMIISMVYSVIDPIHISNYLMDAPNKPSPTKYITHLGDVCTLHNFSYMQSFFFNPYTNQIIKQNVFHYTFIYKTIIAKLFKYMTNIKYDEVGKFMYDVYANIHTYDDYLNEDHLSEEIETKLLEIESKLYNSLLNVITSNYWRKNSTEIVSSIPDKKYIRLVLNNYKDNKIKKDDMNQLSRVCSHLLKSHESVNCFEMVLTNLINMQLTPEALKFTIMNYRTMTTCDDVDPTNFQNIMPLESLKTDTIYLMKKQMQNVLIVYSELLLIMYNMIYFPHIKNSYNIKSYLNTLLEEFMNINEYTRGFSLYLHIMNGHEIAEFMEKYIKFQIIFRTHFQKFLTGEEDENIDENLYLKFLLKDSHKFDGVYTGANDNTICLLSSENTYIDLDYSNDDIYMYDLRDLFTNFSILNNGEYYQKFDWVSVDFHLLKLINRDQLDYIDSNRYFADSFSFEQRMNMVIFRRLVSQDLQHTLAGLVNFTGEPVLQATKSTHYEVFIASLPMPFP